MRTHTTPPVRDDCYTAAVLLPALTPTQKRVLAAAFVAGGVGALSCSLATKPSDYQGGSATGSGAQGGAPSDSGADVVLPPDVVLRVFALGGYRDGIESYGTALNEVWLADLTAGGELGPWRATTPILYGGRYGAGVSFDKLFAVGRSDAVDSENKFIVTAAPFSSDGIGPWIGAVESDTHSDDDLVTVVAAEFAYAIGGIYYYTNDAGQQQGYETDVLVTRLDPDAATVLPWAVAQTLDTGRRDSGAMVHADHLWVVGGRRGSSLLASVEIGRINPADGTLQPFVLLGPVGIADADGGILEHQAHSPAVCSHGSDVYVVGGAATTGPSDVVYRARFDATNQQITAWRAEPQLPRPVEGPACLAHQGRLWVLGGAGPSSRSNDVAVSAIASDGSLGAWTVAAHKLPAGRSHFSVASIAPM